MGGKTTMRTGAMRVAPGTVTLQNVSRETRVRLYILYNPEVSTERARWLHV